jgi:uncharacterized phage protein (TIGR02218 family)
VANPVPITASPIASWLEADLIPLAWCWRIERRDGAVLGFTTHDADLTRGGLIYRAAPGMDPSAIRLTDDLDGEDMEVKGAITHGALSARELMAGRYDGALIEISVVDWANAAEPAIVIASGRLAGLSRQAGRFTAEISLRPPGLDRGVGVATSPTCRARLGDKACGVDLGERTQRVTIQSSAGADLTVMETLSPALYSFGELRWIDGAYAGQRSSIIDQQGQMISLSDSPASAPIPGTRAILTQGCDKRIDTCRSRFANAINFRGEPYLPGMDLLTRYPGG